MSLNLFQKHNPNTFNEVIGQDITVKALQKRAKENNFSQVIRFIGYTGTGKTALSRLIAKSLLCQNKDDYGNSCNQCPACKSISVGNDLQNYREINSSNCGIDEIRDLEDHSLRKIAFTESNLKVYYLDEVQEMASKSKAALNNLFKLLERPTDTNYFILGSMEDYNIPQALKNRCVTYKLKPIDSDKIADRLLYICRQEVEGFVIEDEEKANVILSIAENSNGSMRTAISYLERVLDSDIWTEQQLFEELDIVSDKRLDEIIFYILTGNPLALSNYINKDLIYKIVNRLILLYKSLCGIELYRKEQAIISSLKLPKLDKDVILNMVDENIEVFSRIYESYYVQKEYLEFIIMKVLKQNKKIFSSNKKVERIPRK